jgi:AcrR family transcriptional regulator
MWHSALVRRVPLPCWSSFSLIVTGADLFTTLSSTAEDNSIIPKKQETEGAGPERILAVVARMLCSGGTDAVQLVEVARRSRVSLTTIYKHFGPRDELILAAIEAWMESQVYGPLTEPTPEEPLYEGLKRYFRHIFEPWEQNPRMAEAFMRARLGPGGDRLLTQGSAAGEPLTRLFKGFDPVYVEDVLMIITNTVYAMAFRFAAGDVAVTEIMPSLERTLFRLTGDFEDLASTQPSPRRKRQVNLG